MMMPAGMILGMAVMIALLIIAGIALVGIIRALKASEKRKNAGFASGKLKNEHTAEASQYFTVGPDGELVEVDEADDIEPTGTEQSRQQYRR